jgi:hypothetical protein
VETNFLGQKETLNAFVVAHHDSSEGVSIKTLYGPGNAPSTPIQVDGKTYVVDQPSCPLPRLDDAWSKDGLVTLTRNTMPSDATEIFNALRRLAKINCTLKGVFRADSVIPFTMEIFPDNCQF